MSTAAQRKAWNLAGVPRVRNREWKVELDPDLRRHRWVAYRYDDWHIYTQHDTLAEAVAYATARASIEAANAAIERLDSTRG